LEVGSGSGWQTAMLAHIVGVKGKVFAMEIVPELAALGKTNAAKYPDLAKRVTFIAHSAEHGLPEYAPFDRIIAAASAQEISEAWKKQLSVGGKLSPPYANLSMSLQKYPKQNLKKRFSPDSYLCHS
jgi:protein-L-isoaspartate(D-aspartate) O-methyltransferase